MGSPRPRADDFLCFRGILIRLVTGASWVDVEAILDHQASDATLRARCDEWSAAGVFDRREAEAHAAFDTNLGLDDIDIQRQGTKVPGVKKQPLRLGMRWIVETTNTWWSNYGQLRRNTDRRARHRHAALWLATTILIIGKFHTHRVRRSPKPAPIL